ERGRLVADIDHGVAALGFVAGPHAPHSNPGAGGVILAARSPEEAVAASRHVAELRRAFDASFAAPPRDADTSGELVLAIRAAGQSYVIRLRDIDGVHECRKVVPLPQSPPGLL